MEGLGVWCRRARIFLDPLYLSLGVGHGYSPRATEQVKHLARWNAQTMQKASCDQARTPDAGAAMDGDCHASKELAMQLDK